MSTLARPVTWAEPTRGYPPPVLGRWAATWRYALASVPLLAYGAALVLLAQHPSETAPLWTRVVDPLLFGVAVVLIRFRRRHPLAAAVALSVVVAFSASSFGFWAWAVISMATRRRWRWVALTGATTLVMALVAAVATRPLDQVSVTDATGRVTPVTDAGLVFSILLVTVAITYVALAAWGFYVGARRDLVASLTERAETAEREQALRITQAQGDERARIAREMHDVLAHRISLVSMHAGILAYRDDLTSDETSDVARVIQSNAADSLTELRAVLGTLREPGAAPAKPQPSLADLPALVDEARAAGAHVTVSDAVAGPAALPPATGRHAYRIVQEALTNARKHAVDAPVTVSLSGRPGDGLAVEVANPLTTGSGLVGAGLGLVGLAERAQIAGGRCAAGVESGMFVVRAWLPWQP